MTTSTKTTEPALIYCTLRHSSDEDYTPIECRFSDGQKHSAILVDSAHPQLAAMIVTLLNNLKSGSAAY
jgi:hypothetical protein